MQEYDHVEVIVEKETYAKEGIHKGMQGWICWDDCTGGTWLVCFPQCGGHDNIAEILVAEDDMKKIDTLSALLNEHIREQWGEMNPAEVNPVEVTVEKPEYAAEGVHAGMQGRTTYEDVDGSCLVIFAYSDRPKCFAHITIKAGDYKRIPRVEPGVNERIMADWNK